MWVRLCRSVLALLRADVWHAETGFRCRWIGHRRTVGVRAETAVTAVVLSHDDMRWAVAADYRMSTELSSALRARRLVVAKAIRAEKKARKETPGPAVQG